MVLWLQNMEILSRQFFFSDVRQIQKQSCNLTLSFSVPHCAVDNTVPPSDSNISKTVGVNLALVILKLLMFKICGIIGISKIEFFDFSSTERVKQFTNKLKITYRNKSNLQIKNSLLYLGNNEIYLKS